MLLDRRPLLNVPEDRPMTIENDDQAGPQAGGPVGPGIVLLDPASASDPSEVVRVWRNVDGESSTWPEGQTLTPS